MMDDPSGIAAGLGEWRQLFFDTLGLDLTSAPAATPPINFYEPSQVTQY